MKRIAFHKLQIGPPRHGVILCSHEGEGMVDYCAGDQRTLLLQNSADTTFTMVCQGRHRRSDLEKGNEVWVIYWKITKNCSLPNDAKQLSSAIELGSRASSLEWLTQPDFLRKYPEI